MATARSQCGDVDGGTDGDPEQQWRCKGNSRGPLAPRLIFCGRKVEECSLSADVHDEDKTL